MGGVWLRRRGRTRGSAVLGRCYMVLLLLWLWLLMVVLVVVCTMGNVRDGGFVGTGCAVGRSGGVVVMLRWGSSIACSWIGVCVGLCYTCEEESIIN